MLSKKIFQSLEMHLYSLTDNTEQWKTDSSSNSLISDIDPCDVMWNAHHLCQRLSLQQISTKSLELFGRLINEATFEIRWQWKNIDREWVSNFKYMVLPRNRPTHLISFLLTSKKVYIYPPLSSEMETKKKPSVTSRKTISNRHENKSRKNFSIMAFLHDICHGLL